MTDSFPPREGSGERWRLVCLPYAGGGTAPYHRWRGALPNWLELKPICLPGREHRVAEPPERDLRRLVSQIVDELEPALDRPYGALGHSMGGWLTFEMARELRRRGARLPSLLVVSGCRVPGAAAADGALLHTLPDEEFTTEVQRRFGGIPGEVLRNPELLRLLLPILRADFETMETFQPATEPPLDVELLALGGTSDGGLTAAQLAEWRRQTTGRSATRMFPGGHFFLFGGTESDSGSERTTGRPTKSLPPPVAMVVSRLEQIRRGAE